MYKSKIFQTSILVLGLLSTSVSMQEEAIALKCCTGDCPGVGNMTARCSEDPMFGCESALNALKASCCAKTRHVYSDYEYCSKLQSPTYGPC